MQTYASLKINSIKYICTSNIRYSKRYTVTDNNDFFSVSRKCDVGGFHNSAFSGIITYYFHKYLIFLKDYGLLII